MTMVNNSYDFTEKAEISYDDVNANEWYYAEVQNIIVYSFYKDCFVINEATEKHK